MKTPILFFLVVLFFSSCEKETMNTNNFSEASYTVDVTGKWTTADHGLPSDAHFTMLAGMVHNKNAFLWKEGQLASPALETVAEIGDASPLLRDVDSMILAGSASFVFRKVQPPPVGIVTTGIYVNSNFSYFSFASMVAPSPDWFIGLNSFNLYRNNKWIADTTIELYAYDAGTEDGDIFGYSNPPTIPQKPISLLTASMGSVLANGNNPIRAIASIRFRKN